MTKEQRQLCRDLTIQLDGRSRISRDEFLSRFPSATENGKVATKWIEEEEHARDADDLSCALTIGLLYGFAPDHAVILRRLIDSDWHYSHEDLVIALQTWPTAETVDALFLATQWIPKSLEYDDARALAVKAIWELGKIPGREAQAKLELLARSDNVILRENAKKQLGRRNTI